MAPLFTRASMGASAITSRMASRARSIVRTSSHCDIANNQTTVAPSAHSPMAIAPATATTISTWMSSDRRFSESQALRAGATPARTMASTKAGHDQGAPAPASCAAKPTAIAAPASARRTVSRRDSGALAGPSCSSQACMPVSATASTMRAAVSTAAS